MKVHEAIIGSSSHNISIARMLFCASCCCGLNIDHNVLTSSMLSRSYTRNVLKQCRTPSRRNASTTASGSSSLTIKRTVAASVLLVSGTIVATYYFDSRSAVHRYIVTPILRHTLDAETSHKVAVKVLRSGWGPKDRGTDDERLEAEVRNIYIPYYRTIFTNINSFGERGFPIQLVLRLVLTRMVRRWMDFSTLVLVGLKLVASHRNLRCVLHSTLSSCLITNSMCFSREILALACSIFLEILQ